MESLPFQPGSAQVAEAQRMIDYQRPMEGFHESQLQGTEYFPGIQKEAKDDNSLIFWKKLEHGSFLFF